MNAVCTRCGKKVEGEGLAFCPYCGEKLPAAEKEIKPAVRNEEAEKWVQKALGRTSFPERKKILLQGLAACPDSREIAWELLFIGEEEPRKRGGNIDFSIIKCWILEIYRTPGDFSAERTDRMRAELFDSPQLKKCLAQFGDPEGKQQEYLLRLCREYVEIFLEGNSRVMGSFFGFRFEGNREKKLAAPLAEMIGRIRKDEKLLPEQREQLWKTLYRAFSERVSGKTEYLDELI